MSFRWPAVLAAVGMFALPLPWLNAMAMAPADSPGPHWTAQPLPSTNMHYYPQRARDAGISGIALIRCRLTDSGNLAGCFVLAEGPEGEGFGAAALALAPGFRAKPAMKGEWVANQVVTVPIRFGFDDRTALLKMKIVPADAAMVVTFVKSAPERRGRRFDCPSLNDEHRQCQSHPLTWAHRPSVDEASTILADTDLSTGRAVLECSSAPDGSLTRCKVSGDTTPKIETAMLDLAGRLQAKPKADDGTPISAGRILIEFDWAALQPLKRQPLP